MRFHIQQSFINELIGHVDSVRRCQETVEKSGKVYDTQLGKLCDLTII